MNQERTILITGATDGLGRRTAEQWAMPEALLLVHGRDPARGYDVVETIKRAGGSAIFYQADFASLDAVTRLATSIAANHPHLDVIVNNAGIGDGQRRLSQDGYEMHFAVNHLAPFLLTYLLRSCLGGTKPSKVINVASASQSPIDFDDVMLERNFSGYRAYSQSKLANVMHALDLTDDWFGANIACASLHPATFMNTTMVLASGVQPLTSVDVGAEAVLNLVDSPGRAISGQYIVGMRQARANPQAYDVRARQKLRQLSLELTAV